MALGLAGVVALECNVCRGRDISARSCSRWRCLRLCCVRWDSCTDTAAQDAHGRCYFPTAMSPGQFHFATRCMPKLPSKRIAAAIR